MKLALGLQNSEKRRRGVLRGREEKGSSENTTPLTKGKEKVRAQVSIKSKVIMVEDKSVSCLKEEGPSTRRLWESPQEIPPSS